MLACRTDGDLSKSDYWCVADCLELADAQLWQVVEVLDQQADPTDDQETAGEELIGEELAGDDIDPADSGAEEETDIEEEDK